MPTIVLADDHQLFREGLRSLLEKEPGFRVVGEADNGRDAVRLASELRPDVVVMDVRMPDLDGVEATRRVRDESPDTRVVAVSMHAEKRFVTGMLSGGASGYVLKSCAFEEVISAIHTVLAGRVYTSQKVTDVVVANYVEQFGRVAPSAEVLSPREREVLQLLAEGLSSKEMAARLGLSVNTVDTHRRRIADKLGLSSVAALTKYAIREGLTSLDD